MNDNDSGLKHWFAFSRRERIAALILLVLILVTGLLILFFPRKHNTYSYSWHKFDSVVNILTDTVPLSPVDTSVKERAADAQPQDVSTEVLKLKVTCRDPNRMKFADWYALGLPQNLIRTILNYRKAGGVFYDAGDIKKIYGMTDSIYEAILTWIEIPDSLDAGGLLTSYSNIRETEPVNLNRADSVTLLTLPGIGPVLAGRIIRYRKLLGGFYSSGQLPEVYGLTENTLDRIVQYLIIDTALVRKINLNSCTIYDLLKHPYIPEWSAKAILAYRNYKGTIETPWELVREKLLSEKDYNRARPYLQAQ